MSQLLISQYLNEIDLLRKTTGSSTEGVISEAFKDLLKAWSKQNNLVFSAQFSFQSPQKKYNTSGWNNIPQPWRAVWLLGGERH